MGFEFYKRLSLSNKKDKTVFIAQLIISLKLLGAPEFLMDVIKKQVDEKEWLYSKSSG